MITLARDTGHKVASAVGTRAAMAHGRLTMARVIERDVHVQIRCDVSAVQELGPGMRRITLASPELRTFTCSGPDEYFGLMMPPAIDGDPARRAPLVMPSQLSGHAREAIAAMPEHQRPELRWYTVAEHRPALGELDVDVVLHGDAGPGTAWARRATVGDPVGFRSGGALYRPGAGASSQLLVADETALPAMLAIRDHWARTGTRPQWAQLHLEVSDLAALGYDTGNRRLPEEITVHHRGGGAPGSAVIPALATSMDLGTIDYAWLCGESGLVTALRRHLVNTVGVHRRSVLFSGYWRLGAARG